MSNKASLITATNIEDISIKNNHTHIQTLFKWPRLLAKFILFSTLFIRARNNYLNLHFY